ncbi:ABC-2 family transporter protein [Candidatus Daviesbacteria bacterium]|nr:ABC-2 family transporter protein [Candidatus Daviesbacteria bacterium]
MINKYLAVFKISWEQGLVYRLNFLLWRVRSALQLLLVYFIWWTVFQSNISVFNYSQAQILTYIIVSALIRAIILSSRVIDVAGQINEGSIVNFLVKPLGFIKYYFARDLADKLLNIAFVIFEITLLLVLLQPPLQFQQDPGILTLFFLATVLGLILYFAFAFIIGMLAFWVENAWGPLFLVMILLEGFGGGLFPIDILPKTVSNILMLTPFPYFIYFPAKIYLGTLPLNSIVAGFTVLSFWVVASWLLMLAVLKSGLRRYSAYGY